MWKCHALEVGFVVFVFCLLWFGTLCVYGVGDCSLQAVVSKHIDGFRSQVQKLIDVLHLKDGFFRHSRVLYK